VLKSSKKFIKDLKSLSRELRIKKQIGLVIILIMGLSFLPQLVIAQSGDSTKKQATHQEDAMDVIVKVVKINRNSVSDSENLQPGKLYTSVFPAIGYALSNGVTFILASNYSFYTSSLNSTNLSAISLNPLYSLKHQVIVPLISSIWLKDNKINILGDYRYYQYPSYTFGLGGKRLLAQSDSVDYSYIKISQEVLYRLGHNLYGGIGYNLDYHYNIHELGDDPQYETYNNEVTKTTSSGLVGRLKYDDRVNINNPKNAFYANFVYRDNLTFLGSDNNWQEVEVEFRKYISLSPYRQSVLAFWSWNEFTFGNNVPYFDLPSTGWDDYSNSGRGYIQGRFRGTGIIYLEGEYRFDILNNGLLGGVVFVNGESVPNYPANSFTDIHPGGGIGLRLKMNKYSNTNLCVDYGFGDEGSRGFFFNVGEVF
jgi:outer membrane protein assembly factor BamA